MNQRPVSYEYRLLPGDYRARIATLKAYVYDCMENNHRCKTAEQLLNQIIKDYPDNKEVRELARMFDYSGSY